jgi:quinol monooxygenase YgiN
MIIATLRMTAPPDKRDEFWHTLRLLTGPIGVQPGCLSCHVYRDPESENEFVIIQEWATQADLEHHLRTDHFRKMLIMLELSSEWPDVQFHTIVHTAGMEAIENARR